jgi:uncharacterized protein (TIGR03382 family)
LQPELTPVGCAAAPAMPIAVLALALGLRRRR